MWSRFLIIIASCLFWTCQTSQSVIDSKSDKETNTISSASQNAKVNTFRGKFRSTQGIKTAISCYCDNGGYLKTEAGETIAICLDGIKAAVSCEILEVKGQYITKSNDPEPENPCSQGQMEIFMVSSYQCK